MHHFITAGYNLYIRLLDIDRQTFDPVYLPRDILDEASSAVVFLAGPPARLTLTRLAEDALRAELERLKDRFNQGKDFPARDEELRGGRPIAA